MNYRECYQTQAEEVAQYFLSLPEDERPTAVFSSPYCTMSSVDIHFARTHCE